MSKNTKPQPDWENVLSAATRLQHILPGATLVGGTASAIYANHRVSYDADHILVDLRGHYKEILAQLESVAGWKTARTKEPVIILGSLDGIETGVRQLIREAPLETVTLPFGDQSITLPSPEEMLRIKGVLILKRNATRDYLDFAALADHMGDEATAKALQCFDRLYPQASGESSLQQLQAQLVNPMPYDLDITDLAQYKKLQPRWQDWDAVKTACAQIAVNLFDRICESQKEQPEDPQPDF
ncbi:hypothetical protein OH491_24185 [Termitidicoccus mucosus]|uniref:Nucleotidyl transferase AbiEii toxin, Type IV TA system n=1 Tax=Termitidicoccus mucosus TaxID=1184151 RepID=A0A178IQW4_9BACT|nr:hypothetical protein AW736_02270 [Opitutaceae bacterium TSB47]